ncbi:hypothetical protein ACJX0J_039052, partial [Zea mays]
YLSNITCTLKFLFPIRYIIHIIPSFKFPTGHICNDAIEKPELGSIGAPFSEFQYIVP